MKPAYLILENGEVFAGQAFGAVKETLGEVVFTTAMTGYLETLTDPSYYGQIVVQTFPLIGNYGIIEEDFEAPNPALKAYIVKYPCENPSNFRSGGVLSEFLLKCGIVGLCGIDTRKLTRIIRNYGVLNGKITYSPPSLKDKSDAARYSLKSAVSKVSPSKISVTGDGAKRIALLDFGSKQGIVDAFLKRDYSIIRFPYNISASEILSCKPDGIVLSNGPGDPADPLNAKIIKTIRELDKSGIPILGICLGHQLFAIANGYKTKKLKFGHRGSNHAVKEISTGRTYITSQNHGYAVVSNNGSFVNITDGSCEGLDYGVSFSVQFHPEACGGPLDTSFLFDRFIERIEAQGKEAQPK